MIKEMALKGLHVKVREVFTSLKLPHSARILILGAGEGAFENWLDSKGYTDLTAVDYFTKHKVGKAKFKKLNLNDPDFSKKLSRRYDVVIAMEIIEHLHNTYSFVENLSNLLTKKGTAIVSTPNIHSWLARADKLLTGCPTYFIAPPHPYGHLSMIHFNILSLHCKTHGLKIHSRTPYGTAWTYASAYPREGLRSWLYLGVLITLHYLLRPLMLVNRHLGKGVISIFTIRPK